MGMCLCCCGFVYVWCKCVGNVTGQEGERLIVTLDDGGELHVKAKNLELGSTCAPVCLRARAEATNLVLLPYGPDLPILPLLLSLCLYVSY
jgi:hypothetical protein